jgi:hypothetical protein
MTTAEVLKLVEAGYTKAEILAMDDPEQPGNVPGGEGPEEPEQVGNDAGGQSEGENGAGASDLSTNYAQVVDNLTNKIADLTNIIHDMQKANARGADSGAPAALTSEDAVKNFFGVK